MEPSSGRPPGEWRKEDFLKAEYGTLRQEVKETKGRIFKLAGLGIVGMPSAYYLANTYHVDVLILSLPLLICTVVLLYLSESKALMRCGKYIRTVIEPEIRGEAAKSPLGWEHWLEEMGHGEQDRRIVDKLLTLFFYILWIFYYIASVGLAVQLATAKYQDVGRATVLGTYVGIGIIFVAVLVYSFRQSTSTTR
jgi:hypothetical protein